MALLATGLGATGCGGGQGSGGGGDGAVDDGRGEFVRTGVRRTAGDPSARDGSADAVRSFTADLYRELARGAAGNVVCSPYSVAVALAMTRNGARGRTAGELDTVLHAPASGRLNAGLNALARQLEGRAGRWKRADGSTGDITLDVANSLWGQRGVAWATAFLDELARDYGAGIRLADYIGDAEGARKKVNAWVADRTHKRITELLPAGVLDPTTRLVLVNAIYLKAPWETPFDEGATRPAPFTRGGGSRVTVPMMAVDLHGAGYLSGPGWQAVDLPYAGAQLAMAVVVPERGRLGEVERTLDGAALRGILTGFRPDNVSVRLPRWSFRAQASLRELLSRLGMPTAFSAAADFGAMTTQERLRIDAVVHEAFVAVAEPGTEAAAATAAVVGVTAAAPPELTVTADRPFVFVIHDVETATPLFIGRVADPTAG
jgi:serpin B